MKLRERTTSAGLLIPSFILAPRDNYRRAAFPATNRQQSPDAAFLRLSFT